MGRTLEVLQRRHESASIGTDSDAARSPFGAAPPMPALDDATEEIPFIEIGARGTPVELSPALQQSSAVVLNRAPAAKQSAVTFPAPAADGRPNRAETSVASAVAFQPWPAAPTGTQPAGLAFGNELVAYHQPHHPISEQYRALLKSLERQRPLAQSRSLLFTALARGAGTTTVLLNLALTAIQQGSGPVIVVDANLYQPALADRLGLAAAPGMREVLAGQLPWRRALQPTSAANLFVIAAGAMVARGAPDQAVPALLRRLRRHFAWILVDGPSWDIGTELLSLGRACDSAYLVLRPSEVETPRTAELTRLLPSAGCDLGGFVIVRR